MLFAADLLFLTCFRSSRLRPMSTWSWLRGRREAAAAEAARTLGAAICALEDRLPSVRTLDVMTVSPEGQVSVELATSTARDGRKYVSLEERPSREVVSVSFLFGVCMCNSFRKPRIRVILDSRKDTEA